MKTMKFRKLRGDIKKAEEELEAQKAITALLQEKILEAEKEKEALSREKEQMTQKSQAEKQKLLQLINEAKEQAAKTLSQHAMDFMAGMDDIKNKMEKTRKALEWSKSNVPKLQGQLAQCKVLERELSANRKIAFNIQDIIQDKRGRTISMNFQVEVLKKELHEAKVREHKKCQEYKKRIGSFQNELEERRKELETTKEVVNHLKKQLDTNTKFCSSGEKWLCCGFSEEKEDNATLLDRMEQMKAEMKEIRGRQARLEWRVVDLDARGNEEGEGTAEETRLAIGLREEEEGGASSNPAT